MKYDCHPEPYLHRFHSPTTFLTSCGSYPVYQLPSCQLPVSFHILSHFSQSMCCLLVALGPRHIHFNHSIQHQPCTFFLGHFTFSSFLLIFSNSTSRQKTKVTLSTQHNQVFNLRLLCSQNSLPFSPPNANPLWKLYSSNTAVHFPYSQMRIVF